jgi:phosphopantothenoylcysteine decarboxylase/phosphopantothenate--cysteine ligase
MYNSVKKELKDKDAFIMPAAVADYKPAEFSHQKIKKESGNTNIPLVKTIDILSSINKAETKIIGFALETENEISNAELKLKSKNMDLIVLNSLKDKGAGFEHDSNKITIIDALGNKFDFPLATKLQTANIILNELIKLL